MELTGGIIWREADFSLDTFFEFTCFIRFASKLNRAPKRCSVRVSVTSQNSQRGGGMNENSKFMKVDIFNS